MTGFGKVRHSRLTLETGISDPRPTFPSLLWGLLDGIVVDQGTGMDAIHAYAVAVGMAAENDVISISDVLCEAAEWMALHRRPLWFADSLGPAFVKPYVDRSEFVTARFDGRIIAVMTLQWRDLEFWPDHDDNDAGYLHKIAVRREVAGRGVPAIMVDWAANHVREKCRKYLRLDCDPQRSLCAVYSRLGFKRVDVLKISPPNRTPFSVARFQKPIT